MDPASARIKILLARELINRYLDGPNWGNLDLIDRAGSLIAVAAAIEPTSDHVIFAQGFLLRAQGRFAEAIALLEHLIERAPNNSNAFRQLGVCKMAKGRAGEALSLLHRSIRLDPLSPNHRFTCHFIGRALALLGCDAESIEWQQRALAADLGVIPALRERCYLDMASAYGHLGHTSDAQHAVTKAYQFGSHATVRSYASFAQSPYGLPDPTSCSRCLASRRACGSPAYVIMLRKPRNLACRRLALCAPVSTAGLQRRFRVQPLLYRRTRRPRGAAEADSDRRRLLQPRPVNTRRSGFARHRPWRSFFRHAPDPLQSQDTRPDTR